MVQEYLFFGGPANGVYKIIQDDMPIVKIAVAAPVLIPGDDPEGFYPYVEHQYRRYVLPESVIYMHESIQPQKIFTFESQEEHELLLGITEDPFSIAGPLMLSDWLEDHERIEMAKRWRFIVQVMSWYRIREAIAVKWLLDSDLIDGSSYHHRRYQEKMWCKANGYQFIEFYDKPLTIDDPSGKIPFRMHVDHNYDFFRPYRGIKFDST